MQILVFRGCTGGWLEGIFCKQSGHMEDFTVPGKDLKQCILDLLAAERSAHGHGSAAEIDQKLGKSEGYLGRVLRGEIGLQLDTLGQVLDVLGVEPAEFFGRALGAATFSPQRMICRSRGALVGPPLSAATEEMLKRVRVLIQNSAIGQSNVPDETRGHGELDEFHRQLERLDEIQFSDPAAAMAQDRTILPAIIDRAERLPDSDSHRLLARALGISSSIDRRAAHFRSAVAKLDLAFSLNQQVQSLVGRAELVHWGAYLVADQGEYSAALELAKQASDLHMQCHDLPGVGKTLLQRAAFRYYLRDFEGAEQNYEAGLLYMPDSAWRWRIAAYQGLGFVHLEQGDLVSARRCADRATAEHRTRQGPNWWKLLWLQGELGMREGNWGTAERFFDQARMGFYRQENPFEVALISLRLAKIYLRTARLEDIRRLASEMMGLLYPLNKHPVAFSALHEFTRAALTGNVTHTLLDEIFADLEQSARDRSSLLA